MANIGREKDKCKINNIVYDKKNKEVNIEADHKLIPTNRKLRNTNSNCFQIPSCNTTTRKVSQITVVTVW